MIEDLERARPLGPYSGPCHKRPKSETALLVWMKNNGCGLMKFARAVGSDPKTVTLWMWGQVIPGLVYAYKIEKVTEGAVSMESWLGTELARLQWKHIHADHDVYAEIQRKSSKRFYDKERRKRRGQDTREDAEE